MCRLEFSKTLNAAFVALWKRIQREKKTQVTFCILIRRSKTARNTHKHRLYTMSMMTMTTRVQNVCSAQTNKSLHWGRNQKKNMITKLHTNAIEYSIYAGDKWNPVNANKMKWKDRERERKKKKKIVKMGIRGIGLRFIQRNRIDLYIFSEFLFSFHCYKYAIIQIALLQLQTIDRYWCYCHSHTYIHIDILV